MTLLVVPSLEAEAPDAWQTLGPQVCAFIEGHLVHGPGDLRGQPYRLDDEKRAIVYRLYQVFPKGHARAGRRRTKRATVSVRKGWAKTEFAAVLAAVELHPAGPVRCDGWDADGQPVGRPVRDVYIPMVAYTEEQSDELAYFALYTILSESKSIVNDFDIGLKRIARVRGDGKAVALASAPNSRDGARTTFQHFDETHRFTLERLRKAHSTMLANIPKRKMADGWSLETTTAYTPGEQSVAEKAHEYAKAIVAGKVSEPQFFFFHRQASDGHDLTTPEGRRAAVDEASGPVAAWSDNENIVAQWDEPDADHSYLERVWLNRPVAGADKAFDVELFKSRTRTPAYRIPRGAWVTLGFDGSRYRDATGLIATEVVTGFQQVVYELERPLGPRGEGWEVPVADVNAAVATAFDEWQVWRLYADPPYWESAIADWSGRYGEERVIPWLTRLERKMAEAILAFISAIVAGDLSHEGHAAYVRHVGNAHKRMLNMLDDQRRQVWVVQKSRPDSPDKIDLGVAGILSWRACLDARAEGVGLEPVNDYRVESLDGDSSTEEGFA